ncbi:MAG: LCP family protein [Clostridia bacterium]|nr:LCP family protein [Clostridia bacterium]
MSDRKRNTEKDMRPNLKKDRNYDRDYDRRYYEENRRASSQKSNKKRKKKKSKAPAIILILFMFALVAVGGYVVYERLFGGADPVTDQNSVNSTVIPDDGTEFSQILQGLESKTPEDTLTGEKISVDNLSITEGLDETWLNVLLLGVDARSLVEPARSDTMIICSINKDTGDVKLSTIMRDTDVSFEGHPSTRINTAYFYGGAELAIRVVNENFGMNISHFVCVDFAGFAAISEILGGVTIDITENEMKHINLNVVEQYHLEIKHGRIEYDAAYQEYLATELKEFGTDVHLNGMQTLGYARIRKLDSDYARAERQRLVLNELMTGLQNASISELVQIFGKCSSYFRTNLSMNEILEIAMLVLNRTDFTAAEQMRLPVTGSYKEEKRNDDARLYDMDKAVNIRELHNFIYR